MITKITLHDDGVGDFIYERVQGDDWMWNYSLPTLDGKDTFRSHASPLRGDEVLYQAVLGIVPRSAFDTGEEEVQK